MKQKTDDKGDGDDDEEIAHKHMALTNQWWLRVNELPVFASVVVLFFVVVFIDIVGVAAVVVVMVVVAVVVVGGIADDDNIDRRDQ